MIEISPVKHDEQEELFAMAQRSWSEWMPHARAVTDPGEGARYFASQYQIDKPHTSFYWALIEAAHIGFAHVELREDWRGLSWAEITDFYIDPQWRRRGNGTEFAHALLEWLEEQGIYRVDLNVRVSLLPVAATFWERLGFEVVAHRFRRQDAEPYPKSVRS